MSLLINSHFFYNVSVLMFQLNLVVFSPFDQLLVFFFLLVSISFHPLLLPLMSSPFMLFFLKSPLTSNFISFLNLYPELSHLYNSLSRAISSSSSLSEALYPLYFCSSLLVAILSLQLSFRSYLCFIPNQGLFTLSSTKFHNPIIPQLPLNNPNNQAMAPSRVPISIKNRLKVNSQLPRSPSSNHKTPKP